MYENCVLFKLYLPFPSCILNDIYAEIICDTSVSAHGICVVCPCLYVLRKQCKK